MTITNLKNLALIAFAISAFLTAGWALRPPQEPVFRACPPYLQVEAVSDVASTSLEIKNCFEATLHSIRVNPSCGCTLVSGFKSELMTGESTVANVAIDTSNLENDLMVHCLVKYCVAKQWQSELVTINVIKKAE